MSIKVTLLGDSIRQIGYGTVVPTLLGEGFDVWQPKDNCRFAAYTLRGMYDWKNDMAGSRVVHWNNGLWDVCDLFGDGAFTPLDVYIDTMLRIAKLLTSRHEKVIFAATTPVRTANPHNTNERIKAYNAALIPRLTEMGIAVNDLFTPLYADIEKYIRSDDLIHLTDEGIALCGALTCEAIRKAANE